MEQLAKRGDWMRSWKRHCILTGCLLLAGAGAASASSVFTEGDTGESVRALQKMLASAGTRIVIDGYYGKGTQAAIREFQIKKGLPADGVMGRLTYHMLSDMVKSGYTIATGDRYAEILDSYRWRPNDPKRAVIWTTEEISPLRDVKAQAIMTEAQKYIGVPYVFGGTTPGGFDCSGFIQYVFRKQGLELPRTADQQYELGDFVIWNALEPGDLVFFTTYEEGVSHSGLYLGNGNFISATSSGGVMIADMTSGYWRDCYIGAKRIL